MGTHPIFESDFDCLTDLIMLSRTLLARPMRQMATGPKHVNQGKFWQNGFVAEKKVIPGFKEKYGAWGTNYWICGGPTAAVVLIYGSFITGVSISPIGYD